MRCEIITINSINYGNRLQNYALQEILKKLGLKVTTNRIEDNVTKRLLKELLKCLRNKYYCDYYARFDVKNIKYRYTSRDKIESESIDYFIAGSDQIWNPNFDFNSEREFLTFAPSRKKIAYAASTGISELSNEEKSKFRNYLKDFRAISVRENDASEMLSDLLEKKPEVVLDPTLLLTIEDWKKIIAQSQVKIEKPFIVKYFLGIRSEKIERKINDFATKKGYEIIDVSNRNCPYPIGPAEFVYLLSNSTINYVDSFHGTVFSILFNKSFYTFSRPNEHGYGNMNSRFETVFSRFPLKERYIFDVDKINFSEQLEYDETNKILEYERKKSIAFLKKAIGINSEE